MTTTRAGVAPGLQGRARHRGQDKIDDRAERRTDSPAVTHIWPPVRDEICLLLGLDLTQKLSVSRQMALRALRHRSLTGLQLFRGCLARPERGFELVAAF